MTFDYSEPELTPKQIARLERQQIRGIEQMYYEDMVVFRKYCLKVAGGRKKLLNQSDVSSWEEFAVLSIFSISQSLDIDEIPRLQILKGEIHNENTQLVWSSYSQYYKNKHRIPTSRKSSLEDFL